MGFGDLSLTRIVLAMAAALVLAPAHAALAAQGAALVLDVSGRMQPGLTRYGEIPATTTVTLERGARLVFVHYFTCRTVTVVGGAVRVEADGYAVGSGLASEDSTRCPRRISLKRGAEVGGIMVRGIRPPPPHAPLRLSTQPSFVVVGARAGDVAAVRIVRGGQTMLEAPLAGPRFEWPAGAPELLADTDYELTVLFRTTRDEPATGTFRTLPPSETSAPGPVLLDVD